jgi:hypothetical protein
MKSSASLGLGPGAGWHLPVTSPKSKLRLGLRFESGSLVPEGTYLAEGSRSEC